MNRRLILWSGAGTVAFAGALFGAWLLSLPSARTVAEAPPLATDESEAILRGLKAPKRERPLIAVIGINDATETTDYLMPYGILRRSDVADAVLLATAPGPVKLYPALTVEPHAGTGARPHLLQTGEPLPESRCKLRKANGLRVPGRAGFE